MPERRYRRATAAIAASWFLVLASVSIGAPSATATPLANGQTIARNSSSAPIQLDYRVRVQSGSVVDDQIDQALRDSEYASSLNTGSDFGVAGITPQLDASKVEWRSTGTQGIAPRCMRGAYTLKQRRSGRLDRRMKSNESESSPFPDTPDPRLLGRFGSGAATIFRKPTGADSGYGLRKIVEKHALDEYAPSAIAFYGVIAKDDGNQVEMNAPITHYRCSGWGIFRRCKAVEMLTAIMVTYLNNMGGANADGHQLGVNTAYCDGYYGACPDWAANALNKVTPIWRPDS